MYQDDLQKAGAGGTFLNAPVVMYESVCTRVWLFALLGLDGYSIYRGLCGLIMGIQISLKPVCKRWYYKNYVSKRLNKLILM